MSPKKAGPQKPLFYKKRTSYNIHFGPFDPDTVVLIKAVVAVINILIVLAWGKFVYDALVARPFHIEILASVTIGLLSIVWYNMRFLLRKRDND
jgi:hypothetical protein